MKAIIRCLVALAGIFIATAAAAQTDVVIFGRIVGADHVGAVPADWSARVVLTRRTDDGTLCSTSSQGELYACVARANTEMRIAAQADGYQAQIKIEAPVKDNLRVRPDFVLKPITRVLMQSKDPAAFEDQLKVEAEVAPMTGRTDVFEVNYERYKQIAEGQPGFAEAAKRFENSTAYQGVIKDPAAVRVPRGALQHLTRPPNATVDPADQFTLMQVIEDQRLAPDIRRSAVRVLSGVKGLSPDVNSKYLDVLRKWSQSPESEFFGVATGSLTKRGTATDQEDVVRMIQASPSSTKIKAIQSFEGTLPASTERAVTGVVTTTQDTDLKVTSLRALKGSTNPETLKVVAQQTAPTESEAVRMQAVTVLGAAPSTPEASSALAKIAKTDASAQVRAAAAAALNVKR